MINVLDNDHFLRFCIVERLPRRLLMILRLVSKTWNECIIDYVSRSKKKMISKMELKYYLRRKNIQDSQKALLHPGEDGEKYRSRQWKKLDELVVGLRFKMKICRDCYFAEEHGLIEQMKYNWFSGGRSLDNSSNSCYFAARAGHLECLKFGKKLGCKFDNSITAIAAQYGHLDCLKWAHENGCPLPLFWLLDIY